jgi:hypothetical protein
MFQLVLQFRADNIGDYDELRVVEEQLACRLDRSATVDGHDFGSGEFNIFILTADPEGTFREVQDVCRSTQTTREMSAAYRSLSGDEYFILWPPNSTEFRVS